MTLRILALFFFTFSIGAASAAAADSNEAEEWLSEDQQASQSESFSSEEEASVSEMIELHNRTSKLTKSMVPQAPCPNCKAAWVSPKSSAAVKLLEFEKYETCQPERNYQQQTFAALAKKDPWKPFFETRSNSTEAPMPRECVAFVMRGFLGQRDQPSESFASCPGQSGLPRQGEYKACVTEDYVNLVYNSFVDVADCMGLSQKALLPKFMNESGLHLNSFGSLKVMNKKNKKIKSLLDLKICSDKTKMITDLKQLPICKEKVRSLYLAEETAQLREFSKTKNKEKLKKWRQDQEAKVVSLRTVFDHQRASDTWLADLTKILESPTECKKMLAENICEKNQTTLLGGDSGIGQFTKPAADEVAKHLTATEDEIRSSPKASCKRLAALPNVFDTSSGDLGNRCDFIRSPPNPISSFIRYGTLMRSMKNAIDKTWSNRNIDRLLKSTGLGAQEAHVKETLALLGYNAGPGTAVILFENWLKARATNHDKPIRKEDLHVRSSSQTQRTKNQGKANQLDFANYVKRYKYGATKGYLNAVKDAAEQLDQELGKNRCTTKNFLQF